MELNNSLYVVVVLLPCLFFEFVVSAEIVEQDDHISKEDSLERQDRQFGFLQVFNQFGVVGNNECKSAEKVEGEYRVGECSNSESCTLDGGLNGGSCASQKGICCVHTNHGECGQTSAAKFSYFYSQEWPKRSSGSSMCMYTVKPKQDTCFIRLDILTLEMEEMSGSCVHDRLTVQGGKEPSGQLCGNRGGEVTLVEVDDGKDVKIIAEAQSIAWRYQIGITQISCSEASWTRSRLEQETNTGKYPCGRKNPSLNVIGKEEHNKDVIKTSLTEEETVKIKIEEKLKEKNEKKLASKVFRKLVDLSKFDEFELDALKKDIYKPSFPRPSSIKYKRKHKKNHRGKIDQNRSRILYGNETSTHEYPWQISMWIGRSHFCGGTLINSEWAITAAHCVDLQYRNHFERVTVSLSDHNVEQGNNENTFRKLKRIVRFPTYDENYLHGDLAMLQFDRPVDIGETRRPACLPVDHNDFGFRKALITGWGYTETTKALTPRPKTSDVLREAEVFILPQDLCIKHSPFPITDRMICTFKGPLGVETTCQGDSGGPLVVSNGTSNDGSNRYVLVGATSFGVSTCEGPYPSMFSRVSTFLDFIYAAMVPAPMQYLIDYQTPKILTFE